MNAASDTLAHIRQLGLVPVVRAASADEAMRAIDAIKEGGIDVLEITMTVPGAVRVIEQVCERYAADAVIGAGTVLDPETARLCILAGAQFIVSPSTNYDTIALCRRYGIPVMPGALTPTEVVNAWQAGADMVKVFPCSALGGASYLKALKAPLPQIELIPTGGISQENAAQFIAAGAAALGIGADLADLEALRQGRSKEITQSATRYRAIVNEVRAAMRNG